MYSIERLDKIVEILKQRKSISVSKLCDMLFISPATARRDLTALEKKGVIRRTFGGAVLVESNNEEGPIVLRDQTMIRAKRYMCEKASEFIRNGQALFLDSSSTVSNLVPFLNDFRYLTFITNGLNVATALTQNTNFKVTLLGGEILTRSNSTVGPVAEDDVRRFFCDIAIFSCTAIDLHGGVSEGSVETSAIKRIMMERSDVKILVADCTKFGQNALSKTADVKDFDIIITDERPNDAFVHYCDEHSIRLLY